MRKFRVGESVTATMKIGSGIVKVRGTIIRISPDNKFAKLRLDDDMELLIETRFLRGV